MVIRVERRQYGAYKLFIAVHHIQVIHGIVYPAAELVKPRFGLVFILEEPEGDILVDINGIMQPAALVHMVPQRAADGVVFTCMAYRPDKLRENITIRRFFEMFAKGPPPVIIDLLYNGIRAL
jgi:hypothetical protein